MLPNASEFLAINANLLKIAFGRAFAREIRYMGEQYDCTGWFVSDLVVNPEDRFSRVAAHSVLVGSMITAL